MSFFVSSVMEVTKNSFTDDGFFKTGDTGKVDEDGYFVILGRKEIYFHISSLIIMFFASLAYTFA